jgi:hypothetical protein
MRRCSNVERSPGWVLGFGRCCCGCPRPGRLGMMVAMVMGRARSGAEVGWMNGCVWVGCE